MVVTLEYMVKELERLQEKHIKLGRKMVEADNGNIFPFDLFATAVLDRSVMLIEGFKKLIPDNFICAAPLVRLQLDNYLRTFAVQRVDINAHEFAIAVINGKRIRDFRDKDTKRKLTDAELVGITEKTHPGITDFYSKASGYIHFSDTLIFNSISVEKGTSTIQGSISKNEPFIPDRLRIEAAISMYSFTELLLNFLEDWTFTKNNAELVANLRDKGVDKIYIRSNEDSSH